MTVIAIVATLLLALRGAVWMPPAVVLQVAVEADAAEQPAAEDGGVFLPGDRSRERQLDRVRRLIAAEQWGDAAALLDELLADDRDAFMTATADGGTRRSIRGEAARLIDTLPAAGRDAYQRLFRSRADRALADAVAGDDASAVVAVARRWFATPAGRRAAVLAAEFALEADDPRTAQAWLARLGTSREPGWEPTLSLMRAVAAEAAGDREAVARELAAARSSSAGSARLAGRDLPLSAVGVEDGPGRVAGVTPPAAGAGWRRTGGDGWPQPGGDAARNAVVESSRPLLVPRYRVPLVRHPEEARLLELRRREAVAAGATAAPASQPIAVGGTIVVQTPAGIMGVDFETGKRLWMQAAIPAAADAEAALGRGFDDATSGGLSSDGVRVFAVESHPDALTPPAEPVFAGTRDSGDRSAWRGGNVLTAYDVAEGGTVRWRLPRRDRDPTGAADAPAQDWFLGAPLVVGHDLFVLVEAAGQVRLDVLDALRGTIRWSQPLADIEERLATANPDAYARRLAGLTPALGEGVLVCPLGGGAVVGIDLATRTLLWAHSYRVAGGNGDAGPAAVRLRALAVEAREPAVQRGGDPWPVVADGRVVLAPYDADEVICLGLRDGGRAWAQAIRGRRQVAGVVGGSVILVGPEGVDAVAADTGRGRWTRPHQQGVRPSGRGLMTGARLFLPVDAPGVVEIDLATGGVVGRHAVRGGGPPGNLVAFRGEVVSRGIDSLDVFHQTADLESKVETAAVDAERRPWADYWSGQLALGDGDVAAALALVRSGARATRVPPTAVAEALVHALRRDFATAVAVWDAWDEAGDGAAAAPEVLRAVVDGCLRARDDATAWRACRRLAATAGPAGRLPLIPDPFEPGLEVDPARWMQGRLGELAGRAGPAARDEIAALAASVWPAAAPRSASGGAATDPAAPEWPLGRVVVNRSRRGRTDAARTPGSQVVRLPLVGAVDPPVAGLAIAYDVQQRRLHVIDGYGRRIVEPLPLESAAVSVWANQPALPEPSVVGDTLVVRTGAAVTAFDIGAEAGENRVLWKAGVRPPQPRGLVTIQAAPGGRVARNATILLGTRITEPDDPGEPRSVVAPAARPAGVLVPGSRSVAVLDPTTGRVLWERQGLPRIAEWTADDEVACGCTADGRGSVVVSMCDGRMLHAVDLPGRRQRLAVRGRCIVALVPGDDGPRADRVRLDRIDPSSREARPLGEFPGDARGTMLDDGRLAVLAADGTLTVVDVDAGSVAWATRLAGVPDRFDELHVTAWRDRYLVFAGTAEIAALDESAAVSPLRSVLAASEASAPLSGPIWAVSRVDGRPLWQAPATVRHQCLLPTQPADLPVLAFCRHARGGDGWHDLEVLCLDKRTGHAVLDEQRLPVQTQLFVGCELVGDPDDHTIAIRATGGAAPAAVLAFTAAPLAPQPPFQAERRPPARGRLLEPLERGSEQDR